MRYVERKALLRTKGSASALGLVPGDNTIVVVDGDLRSEPYVFRYMP